MGRNADAQRLPRVAGVAVTAEGSPVAYAMVWLEPLSVRRFADQAGRFTFTAVPPGRYRFHARQVGYRPLDTTIVVDSLNLELELVMAPLTLQLDSIVVTAQGPCRAGGPPDSAAHREAFTLLQQLRTSAERFQLLSDSFPFRYDFERTVTDLSLSDRVLRRVTDTARYRSDVRHSYRPGEVVGWGYGAAAGARVLRLPTLAHFADSLFVWSHCWSTAAAPSDSLVALAFSPLETVTGSDIEGIVLLDARTFRLRRAELRLTHVTQALPDAAAITTTMAFREWYAGLVVPSDIRGVTRAAALRGTTRRVWTVREDQRLLQLQHVRTRLR